ARSSSASKRRAPAVREDSPLVGVKSRSAVGLAPTRWKAASRCPPGPSPPVIPSPQPRAKLPGRPHPAAVAPPPPPPRRARPLAAPAEPPRDDAVDAGARVVPGREEGGRARRLLHAPRRQPRIVRGALLLPVLDEDELDRHRASLRLGRPAARGRPAGSN